MCREEDFVTREMEVAQRLADLSTLEQHQSEREEGLNIRQVCTVMFSLSYRHACIVIF